jgi:uncharacterized protein YkwD
MGVLTAGYAPIEQYSQSGNQGPWTDIYAMGAVVHRALVGRKPAAAVDRLGADPVGALAAHPALIERGFAGEFLQAVDWSLRMRIEERPQSVAEWRRALVGERPAPLFPSNPTAVPATPVDFDMSEEPSIDTAPVRSEPASASSVTEAAPTARVATTSGASATPSPEPQGDTITGSAAPTPQRKLAPWLMATAVVLVLIAVMALVLRQHEEPAPTPTVAVQPPPVSSAPPSDTVAVTEMPAPPESPAETPAPEPTAPAPAASQPVIAAPAPVEPVAVAPAPPAPVATTPKPAAPKPVKPPSTTGEPAPFAGIIDAHNRWRRNVGAAPLQWSAPAAVEAQRWADQLAREGCNMRFNPDQARKSTYRDNLLRAYASGPYQGWRRTPSQVVDRWGDGQRYYDASRHRCREAAGGCSQYAQMVAPASRSVGCGHARCPAAEIWVCTYTPPGD